MIQDLIEKIHEAHGSGSDVDGVLSLFNTLERAAGPADARDLVAALERDDADFFTREMFGQILCGFNNPHLLEPLLIAFDRNLAEGHDNDGFQVALWTLVEATPELSADTLRQLQERQPPPVMAETIAWLLEFCSDDSLDTSQETLRRTTRLRRVLGRWKPYPVNHAGGIGIALQVRLRAGCAHRPGGARTLRCSTGDTG